MATKTTAFKIEPSTPTGWYKVINKATGACMDNVKGYAAALVAYRRLNKLARPKKTEKK